jgi:hypothetical protein
MLVSDLASAVRNAPRNGRWEELANRKRFILRPVQNGEVTMLKIAATALSVVVGLVLTAFVQPEPPQAGFPPPPKAKGKAEGKKKGAAEPGGDLRKAYDLLRRLRADESAGQRGEARLRDWTDRATRLYRDGLKARGGLDTIVAREYGAAAHDLARAVDHARNAARFDRPDQDLPSPSDHFGLEDMRDRARRDLYRAYDSDRMARKRASARRCRSLRQGRPRTLHGRQARP